jgi:hypothetical protein
VLTVKIVSQPIIKVVGSAVTESKPLIDLKLSLGKLSLN